MLSIFIFRENPKTPINFRNGGYFIKNLYRPKQKSFRLTEEENEILEMKFKQSKVKNMDHFIRKCLLEKQIYVIDLEPFYKIQSQLSNATNNINQIAKRVNSTGAIYKEDIEDMNKADKKILITTSNINA